jgi:hypothetical protein
MKLLHRPSLLNNRNLNKLPNNKLIAANELEENANIDPAVKRSSLLEKVNAQNIGSEREARIEKGLKKLQAKTLPFRIEEMLQRSDMISPQLTEEETDEMLQKFLVNPRSKESAEKSLKFVDEIISLSPPITEASARELQNWSDKYEEETTPLSMLLDKEAIKLLSLLIHTQRADLGLTDDEAADWFTNWTHPKLAGIVTRLYKTNSFKYKTIDIALESFKMDLDSRQLYILNTAEEQEKIMELHSLMSLFPPAITENIVIQQRLFSKPSYYLRIVL